MSTSVCVMLCTLRQLLLYLSTEFNESYPRFCRPQIYPFVQKLIVGLLGLRWIKIALHSGLNSRDSSFQLLAAD